MKKKFLIFVGILIVVLNLSAQNHPKLLFNKEYIPVLQERAKEPIIKQYTDQFFASNARKRYNMPDASIVYLLTGKLEDAEKAKIGLMNGLKFSWERKHYRVLQFCTVGYDLIADSGVFTKEEKATIKADFFRQADYFMNECKELGHNNRNTDRYVAVGLIGLVFADDVEAKKYIDHGRSWFLKQLDETATSDGAWPETPRYVDVTLGRMCVFAKALGKYDNKNYFARKEIATMAERFMEIVTPKESFANNLRGIPGIGDAYWQFSKFSGSYATLSWLATELQTINPKLAAELMWVWRESGSPLKSDIYAIPYGVFFTDITLKATKPELKSHWQSNIGYLVFRDKFDSPQESYALFHAPARNFYHRHADFGGYSIYYNNTPITLDSGSGVYDERHHKWFKSSGAHNVCYFVDENEKFLPMGGAVKKVSEVILQDSFVSAKIEISNEITRSIACIGAPYNLYAIYDLPQPKKPLATISNLLLMSNEVKIQGNEFVATCLNGISLDGVWLLPQKVDIKLLADGALQEGGKLVLQHTDKIAEKINPYPFTGQKNLSVKTPANTPQLYFLHPRIDGTAEIKSEVEKTTNSAIKLFRLTVGENICYIMINESNKQEKLKLKGRAGELIKFSPKDSTDKNILDCEIPAQGMKVVFVN